jgi:hypothetical protein
MRELLQEIVSSESTLGRAHVALEVVRAHLMFITGANKGRDEGNAHE